MNIFERVKLMNIDEFAEWLDKHTEYDYSTWMLWFDENYCSKCESVCEYIPAFQRVAECCWCELHNKCKFFEDVDGIPDIKHTIKLWLENAEE